MRTNKNHFNMKKLNSTVARILALEAKEKLKTIAEKQIKSRAKEAEASSEFLELKRIHDERAKLTKQYETVKSKLFSKFPKVSVGGGYSGNPLHLSADSKASYVDVADLKDKILIANHVHNIDPTKVVGFVVNQFQKPA